MVPGRWGGPLLLLDCFVCEALCSSCRSRLTTEATLSHRLWSEHMSNEWTLWSCSGKGWSGKPSRRRRASGLLGGLQPQGHGLQWLVLAGPCLLFILPSVPCVALVFPSLVAARGSEVKVRKSKCNQACSRGPGVSQFTQRCWPPAVSQTRLESGGPLWPGRSCSQQGADLISRSVVFLTADAAGPASSLCFRKWGFPSKGTCAVFFWCVPWKPVET